MVNGATTLMTVQVKAIVPAIQPVVIKMSELDELMSIDPLELASSPEKLRKVITFMREARANWDAGVKPTKKEKESKAGVLVDLLKKSGGIKEPEKVRRI